MTCFILKEYPELKLLKLKTTYTFYYKENLKEHWFKFNSNPSICSFSLKHFSNVISGRTSLENYFWKLFKSIPSMHSYNQEKTFIVPELTCFSNYNLTWQINVIFTKKKNSSGLLFSDVTHFNYFSLANFVHCLAD